ncbi:hypothetical protein E2C01_042230 [Portunus trituberculatus]|uniref:Uncharacterized protein n=1 Tax=Portunus trituberculatus TaxID=210409 RepID=A0A5B7FSV6_PORTR|nr:hypothetical protein [Portunus trituberculatus]
MERLYIHFQCENRTWRVHDAIEGVNGGVGRAGRRGEEEEEEEKEKNSHGLVIKLLNKWEEETMRA